MAGLSDALKGREQALADLAWERSFEGQLINQGKGFLSGATSPLWLVAEPRGQHAQGFKAMMDRWEDAAPYANTFGGLSTVGRGLAGAFGMDRKNLAHFLGVLSSGTPVVRNVQDAITGDNDRRRLMQHAREYGAAGY